MDGKLSTYKILLAMKPISIDHVTMSDEALLVSREVSKKGVTANDGARQSQSPGTHMVINKSATDRRVFTDYIQSML